MKVLASGTHVAIFGALHRVMAAEKALRDARARHRLLPTPRPLTSACGLAIAFPCAELEAVRTALGRAASPFELWCSDGVGYVRAEVIAPPAAPEPR